MITTVKARFIQVVGERTGQKQDGSQWTVKQFLFETQENNERYNKKIVVESFNRDFALNIGDIYNVAYEAESRQWVGDKGSMWFTTLRFVGLVDDAGKLIPESTPAKQEDTAESKDAQTEESESELPF